jgi:hypothetical protein
MPGMPDVPRTPRRGAARLLRAGALVLAPLLAVLAGPSLAPAAEAAPLSGAPHSAAGSAAVAKSPGSAPNAVAKPHAAPSLSLDSVTPAVPQKGATLSLSGTVSNPGSTTLHNLSVRLRIGDTPLGSRSDIASVVAGHPADGTDGSVVNKASTSIGGLAPGASAPFLINVQVNSVSALSADGVYEIAAELVSGSGTNVTRAAIARSFLPWFPSTSGVQSVRVATVWPLSDTPRVQAQTYNSQSDNPVPVLGDDQLAPELAAGGRLDQLVNLGGQLDAAKIPVTWVVDPDLLDTAADMSGGYRVATGDITNGAQASNTKAGTGSTTAGDWLTRAKAAVAGQQVVALPYADPDLASIAHNGTGSLSASLLQALGQTQTAGSFTVDSRLGVTAQSDVAWPYKGYLDTSIAKLTRSLHDSTLLVNGASMPESAGLDHTPDAARPIGGGSTAVVADSTIASIFSGDLTTAAAQTEAVQRFLAETLMITLEQPSVAQRAILVMPPRNLSTNGAQVLAEGLQDAVQGKWAQGASLQSITSSTDPAANRTVPPVSAYPASARSGELSNNDLTSVMAVDGELETLKEILTRTYRVTEPFGYARSRSLSTAWRSDQAAGQSYRSATQDYASSLLGAVHLLPKAGSLTLTGTDGRIPITVKNDLQQDVQNLSVRLSSGNQLQLQVSPPQAVTIPGGGRAVTLQFSAAAKLNAQVHVTAYLLATADGQETELGETTFTVNVTSVTGGVIWVVAGGVLLVLLAGVRMYGQRQKRAQEGDDADGESEEPGDGDGDGAPGPQAAAEEEPVPDQDPRIGSESKG